MVKSADAMHAQLANRAAQGELKAMQILLALAQEIEHSTDATAEPASFTKEDEDVLQFIHEQLAGDGKGDGDEEP